MNHQHHKVRTAHASQLLETVRGVLDGTAVLVDGSGDVLEWLSAREQAPLARLGRERLDTGQNLAEQMPPTASSRLARALAQAQSDAAPVRTELDCDELTVRIEARITPLDDAASTCLALFREISSTRDSDSSSETRQLFHQIFHESAAVKFLIAPETGELLDVNRAACNFYGWSRDQLLNKRVQEINTLSADEVATEIAAARRQERQHFRFRHRIANGEIRDVDVFSGPITLDGRTYLLSSIHDVTDRVAREQELEVIREVMDNLPVGVYRSRADQQGRIVTCNAEMLRITEADSLEELQATPIRDLYPDAQEREAFLERLRSTESWHTETLQLRTLKGRVGYFRVSLRPFQDEEGITVIDGITEDVTQEVKNQRDREQLLNILDAIPALVGISDPEGRIVYLNRAARELQGLGPEDPVDHLRAAALHTEDSLRLLEEEAMPTALEQGSWTGETMLRWQDGEPLHAKQTLIAHRDERGELLRISTVAIDVSAEKQHQRRLEWLANRDSLTGVLNRRGFLRVLRQELETARRKERPLSVLMIDLDHFKPVNDQHGHAIGDQVLRQIVKRLRDQRRQEDAVGRLGGEEFSVVLPGADRDDARRIAEACRQQVANQPFDTDAGALQVTVSIGVASRSETDLQGASLLRRGDEALYRAKEAGRNRVEPA